MATLRELRDAIDKVPEEYLDLEVVQWGNPFESDQYVVTEVCINLVDTAKVWNEEEKTMRVIPEFVEFV